MFQKLDSKSTSRLCRFFYNQSRIEKVHQSDANILFIGNMSKKARWNGVYVKAILLLYCRIARSFFVAHAVPLQRTRMVAQHYNKISTSLKRSSDPACCWAEVLGRNSSIRQWRRVYLEKQLHQAKDIKITLEKENEVNNTKKGLKI